MTVFDNVLSAIVPLFALIFLGYFAKKARFLHATDAPVLNRFVLFISLPAFVFHALLTHKLKTDLLKLPLIFWFSEAAILFLATSSAKLLRWPRPAIGTLALQGVFGNTGYIGYPICTAILSASLPAAVIIDQFGMSMALYPGAPILGTVYGTSTSERSIKDTLSFLKTPAFIALIIGILCKMVPRQFVPTSLPVVEFGAGLMLVIGLLGSVTVPVVLIAVGLLLRPSSLPQHVSKVAVIGLFKLIALPVVVWTVGRCLFHVSGSMLEVCVLQAAMPPSATSTVFAGQYDMDGSLAIASFFALTVISAITLPIMLGILR